MNIFIYWTETFQAIYQLFTDSTSRHYKLWHGHKTSMAEKKFEIVGNKVSLPLRFHFLNLKNKIEANRLRS